MQHVDNEMSTAKNIKSKENRKSVLAALTMIKSKLKLTSKIPDNGIAMFSGEWTANTPHLPTADDPQWWV